MPKTRFEEKYKFSVIYQPPKHIPLINMDPPSGSKGLPCFEHGYLTLQLREGTDVGDTGHLVELLNRYVDVVVYTIPSHKVMPPHRTPQ